MALVDSKYQFLWIDCFLGQMRQEPDTVRLLIEAAVMLHNLIRKHYQAWDIRMLDQEDAQHNLIPRAWRTAAITVRGGWGFGLALCVTHLSLDVLLCTASILHLCAIAVNRYLAVTFPLMYSRERVNSQKRILGTIIPVWVVSIAICAPLFIQGFINPEKTLSEDGQACGFFDKTFIIYSSMGSFYVPLAVMIVVDVRAVRKLRRRKGLAAQRSVGQTPPPQPSPTRECVSRSRSSTPPPPPSPDKTYLTVQGNGAPPSPGNDYRRRPLRISFHMNRKSGQKLGYGSTVVEAVPDTRQKMLSNKREKRAAKTLVVVFACFIILWLPFFVMHLANGFCTTCQIPDELFIAFTWLGYVSSAFNPCIYTCFNKEYRRAFIRIICCSKKRRHSFRNNETPTFRSSLRHS
ncbi:D(2) dopamine receptor B-like [Strongylocentrotus purpuratus]|uniref:G-protein coupled receptors family 1 profile domain-containing protein n=1 Tax=Strongylocentrotus purpuratus TaxID=7668 RepID=A0A7M7NWV7_STRPU|nr:D(2) dopamine receptor B-like [Strongylocentrotus purpuratus]